MTGFFASAVFATKASAENATNRAKSQCGKRYYCAGSGNVTTVYISGVRNEA
ncbi:hypothetical protein [Mesorhizobium sp. L103C119B0]|uniref:hypothetical protein n=1 Tax=Mesorhizobium sp. L103C119B0 TaxID=1287085 RepID=UPI0012DDD482|nr:hypothetical protein [Mesorhizobium sp. L103C119B0]